VTFDDTKVFDVAAPGEPLRGYNRPGMTGFHIAPFLKLGQLCLRQVCSRSSPGWLPLLQRKYAFALAGLLAAIIFLTDVGTSLQGAIAVLYISVILLVAQAALLHTVLLTGLGCAALTVLAFVVSHGHETIDSAYSRLGVSLVAIAVTTLLSLRDRSVRTTLAEQARILELTNNTVIIRDAKDKIIYWNDGAEKLYGWTKEEAIGKRCDALLHCKYPAQEVRKVLETEGRWTGEFTRRRRDGTEITLATRWLKRLDPEGRSLGIIETSTDITEWKKSDARRLESERRYQTIFRSAGFATWESDWSAVRRLVVEAVKSGHALKDWLQDNPALVREALRASVVREANQAAVELLGVTEPTQLVGSKVLERVLPGTEEGFADAIYALVEGSEVVEIETRLENFAGRTIDAVVRVSILPEGEPWSRALVMALDVTERNEVRARLEKTSAELAHAGRVSTLGQLAASIAHEVNQPLTAVITYAKSARRWLDREQPDIAEVRGCLEHVVANGSRAAQVIANIKALARKAEPQARAFAVEELVSDAVSLIRREARSADVTVNNLQGPVVAPLTGDRVQIQQVLVNLLVNAIHAMREVEGRKRRLDVGWTLLDDNMLRVFVKDNGTGIKGEPASVFEPFFSTKSDGMGMGLSISQSIVRAHGGNIMAENNLDHGAMFAFSLRRAPAQATTALHTSV